MRLQRQEEKRRAIGCSYSPKGNNESFSGLLSFTGRIKSAYILFIYLFIYFLFTSRVRARRETRPAHVLPLLRSIEHRTASLPPLSLSFSLSLFLSFHPSTLPSLHPLRPPLLPGNCLPRRGRDRGRTRAPAKSYVTVLAPLLARWLKRRRKEHGKTCERSEDFSERQLLCLMCVFFPCDPRACTDRRAVLKKELHL